MNAIAYIPPLVIDGTLSDGHPDEVHDMLHGLVRVNWHTRRKDAKNDFHWPALERTSLTLDCTACDANWTPVEIHVGVQVIGHPGGREAFAMEGVVCSPVGIEQRCSRRLVRFELSLGDES